MKVTYYCGLKHFEDYVCIQHEGFVARKASSWWMERTNRLDLRPPTTTDEALSRAGELKSATHISVWVNKKYPEIVNYCFDNTAFGTIEASDADESPLVKFANQPTSKPLEEVDIPF